ncbi:hypothetical protein Vafri_19420 [Volvox africanus]|uniref:EF-hand domain-containing protein n=1 Tax=Volvox africanus TaxID=51714 RepID=A0A8J4FCX3_9CHLO|nr:hypothetical protein Vafri_19420 [Volvox africanus]
MIQSPGHQARTLRPKHSYNHDVFRTACFLRRPRMHAHKVPKPQATAASKGGSLGGLSVLTNTRPVDRLRFQSMLVFKQFDSDGDGKLTLEELDQYAAYSAERFGPAAEQFAPMYEKLRAEAAVALSGCVDVESFIELVRGQVKVASNNTVFPRSVFNDTELNQLGWDSALSRVEVAAALAIFRLLDFNLDNYVKLEDLRKAQVSTCARAGFKTLANPCNSAVPSGFPYPLTSPLSSSPPLPHSQLLCILYAILLLSFLSLLPTPLFLPLSVPCS